MAIVIMNTAMATCTREKKRRGKENKRKEKRKEEKRREEGRGGEERRRGKHLKGSLPLSQKKTWTSS